jgi:hypothetical protein
LAKQAIYGRSLVYAPNSIKITWFLGGQFVVEALPADFAGYFGAVRFGGLDKIEREKKR